MINRVVPLQVGDLLVLPEDEYRYGLGPVIARTKGIRGTVEYRGELWWFAWAYVANGDPTNHGGFLERGIYIRQASLPQTRVREESMD